MDNYVNLAMRTSAPPFAPMRRLQQDPNLLQCILIAFSYQVAASKVIDELKRAVFYGKPYLPAVDGVGDPDSTHGKVERFARVFRDEVGSVASLLERFTSVPNAENNTTLLHAIIGICGEAGESVEALCAEQLDGINMGEEIGDRFWYSALEARALGMTFEQIMAKNIAKLQARYPDAFSEAQAISRDLQAERAALEGSSRTETAVKRILIEQLGCFEEDITPAKEIAELGADSLDVVELGMALEEEFEIEIADEDTDAVKTVADVIALVEKKIQGKPLPA